MAIGAGAVQSSGIRVNTNLAFSRGSLLSGRVTTTLTVCPSSSKAGRTKAPPTGLSHEDSMRSWSEVVNTGCHARPLTCGDTPQT